MVFPPTQKIQFFMINLCKEVNKEAFFFQKGGNTICKLDGLIVPLQPILQP